MSLHIDRSPKGLSVWRGRKPSGRFARALVYILAGSTAIGVFACRHVQTMPPCPPGAKLMGAPPPKGLEVWCERIVDGKRVKDGFFVAYGVSGDRMIQGSYRNGIQDGEWKLWYENGSLASVDHYSNGLQNGLHTSWYANGQKALEGEYRDGKREGVWIQWDPSGLVSHKMVYRAGKLQK